MDVTAHEIIAHGKVKEIYIASGGDLGATKVDIQFEKFLFSIFGEEFVKKFKADHPAHWLEMMNEFELKKRSGRVIKGTTRIRLPANFMAFHRRSSNRVSCESVIARSYKPEEVKVTESEFLCIGPSIMKSFFDPVISGIIGHLKSLLVEKQLSQVKLMFLVGGFAESPLLQSRIRAEFGSTYKILVPTEAKTAVLRGAVMFGKDPEVVQERVLAETYGTRTIEDFDSSSDNRSKLLMINGKEKCNDRFFVLARANEVVKTNESKKTMTFSPAYPDQTAVAFDFYTTKNPRAPRYVTDEGVRRLPSRTLNVASPDTSKGTNRKVQLKMYFGGTEIKVIAIDAETQNEDTVFIDFLATGQ